MKKPINKAAIYIRVSTESQREEGYSIDAQKEMLTAHCISKGIKNYDYYIDGGYSGSNIDRPELARLITDARSGLISTVLVYKLDRLSRSQKDTLFLIEDVFNPQGIDFISLNESMDTSTPLGRLMLGILSAFAQLERENIRERTRMGMRERVKSGLWPGGGRVPFGYDYDKKTGILVPNKDAKTVEKLYELYLEGRSPAKIAQILGLKYEKLAIQILTRKSNAGYIIYNGEEYLGRHKPIISPDTYQKAMDFMAERSVNKASDSRYLFAGLIYCGNCGAKMRYQKWGKRGCKIVCYSHDKNKPHLVKDPNCKNARHWASDVETIVFEDLFSFSLKQSEPDALSAEKTAESVIEALRDKQAEVSKKLKRLYFLYAEDSGEALLEAIEDLRKQLNQIQKQIIAEQERGVIASKIVDAKQSLSSLRETWSFMTIIEQKNIIRSCVEKIVISGDDIEVFYRFR